MMDYETFDIIKICKGRHNRSSENLSAYQALKQYYIDVYCLYPDSFEEHGLETMVKRAFYDLIDHVDRPSNLLRTFEDAMRIYSQTSLQIDVSTLSMISAMTLIQVRRNGEYINGFNDSILGVVNLGGL